METLILGLAVVVAAVYLYYTFFKKKGCGCGKDDCSVKTHK